MMRDVVESKGYFTFPQESPLATCNQLDRKHLHRTMTIHKSSQFSTANKNQNQIAKKSRNLEI